MHSSIPPLVRTATARDLEAVGDVYRASYPTLMKGYYQAEVLDRSLPVITRAQPALLVSGRFFVVPGAERLEAVGGWSPHPPGEASGPAHLRHFATRPSAVRRGYGSAILQHTLEAAASAGVSDIMCFSTLNAESFYAGHGFRPLGYREIFLGGVPFMSVEMSRAL